MKYVLIGNSTAAVAAIEAIRSVDTKGEITVLSDETHFTYGRPLISYYLWGKTTLEKMRYRPDDFYEKNNVNVILGEKVATIDPEHKAVWTYGGRKVEYDKLLVATGSRPFIPPCEGMENIPVKFNFMTLDDALGLERTLTKSSRVLVVGAGLIGLKCVEGIAERVASVTVVDLANRVLPSILDEGGSAIVQQSLEEKGIIFYLSDTVAKFERDQAILKSGKKIPYDVVVMAVGVRPNVELVKDAGGKVNRGIVTDARQQTDLPDVYAAGDCCESHDITTGQNRILALLPNAYFQGRTAGLNMAGAETEFTNAIPMNAIGFFGLHVATAGVYEGETYARQTSPKDYRKLFVKDGLLKGFILIGDITRAGIYTSLIRNQTPLTTVNFDLLLEKPQLAAFDAQTRFTKLARKV